MHDHAWDSAGDRPEPVLSCGRCGVRLRDGVFVEGPRLGRVRLHASQGREDAVEIGGRNAAHAPGSHQPPRLEDDRAGVVADARSYLAASGFRERLAVPDNCRERLCLAADVRLGGQIVLVGDDDHERQEESEERRDHTEHRRRNLRVVALAGGGHEVPNEQNGRDHDHDREAGCGDQQPDCRYVVQQ